MRVFCGEYDVYVVTEYRDGCVFKTKRIATVLIPLSQTRAMPRQFGDVIFQATGEFKTVE